MTTETRLAEQLLFRAAGWLAEPSGESREATVQLIQGLVAEIKRLERLLSEHQGIEIRLVNLLEAACE